jgi:short-subunit dehydrogenase
MAQNFALITGASGGIGYELAKLFAQDHHNLVLVARSGDKLAQFADELKTAHGIEVVIMPVDLTLPNAPQAVFEDCQRAGLAIDVLVNNAAYGIRGDFAKLPLLEAVGMVQLNIMALTVLSKLFLDPMLARGAGRILNVSSTAGFQPGPMMAVYYASKAYVTSLSEAMANELKGTGVTVTCLCPGPTLTGFQDRAGTSDSILLKARKPMDAATVARDGYRAMMAGKSLVISGAHNWLLAESVRFAPRKLVTAVSRKVLENLSS